VVQVDGNLVVCHWPGVDGKGNMMLAVLMNGRRGIQDTLGVECGIGNCTGKGWTLPFHNLHSCMDACTARVQHSGISLLVVSSDRRVICPPAAWGRS